MAVEIKVPPMGESISEATIAGWRKQPGDAVSTGDILVELETDKVTMEVPAPTSGVLRTADKKPGDIVKLGDLLGTIEEGAASGKTSAPPRATPPQAAQSAAPQTATQTPAAGAVQSGSTNSTVPPGARRLAEESGVDTSAVQGTGLRGQVRKEDIVNHIANTPDVPPGKARAASSGPRETITPMSSLRKKIAERLVQAQQTAAILTTFNEVDMHNMMDVRARYKDAFKDKHGVSLGFMSFFTKAVIDALKAYPAVNAEIRGTDIVYKNYYDIGVAVGGPKGLVVPVVRGVDLMSFAEVEKEITRLAGKVKEGTIGLDDLQGGTFTISNGGVYGSMLSTPILNPPQSGILGMHNIVKRPVVVNDQIVVRPIMYVALSYDHRIIDGREAVSFLVRVKECIENPERMLLEI
ncbi:MAG: 2-oxoglutarate dehydrogenase complex dihydrolipoyllysine-residue succinyltransferase [Spirochaetia bacterium]|nr:2-oxoglutarate dehydrogenase complex dihydrolipoyllysine-residue succinyltransferase [Spirochaetia bacterium]